MFAHLRPAIALLLMMTLLTGVAYPIAVAGVAQIAAPHLANGSLIEQGGAVIGSDLIGQSFAKPDYFHGRPSAAGEKGYDAAGSSGSNLGPTSEKLVAEVKQRAATLGVAPPADLVTASASGLDPHISPAAALAQVERVAAARGKPQAEIRGLVERHVESRTLGLLGQPRVNVLRLNLALDALTR